MISSPCLNCENKHLPKDRCLANCKILGKVQDFQVSVRAVGASPGIDYSEEDRYAVHQEFNFA